MAGRIRALGRPGLALLFMTSIAAEGEAAFAFRKVITVQAGQVATGPHANFPLLLSFTDPNLATIPNGGNVTSSAGHDIVFRGEDASTCGGPLTCRLEHEIERYDPTNGTLLAWVRVPSINDGTSVYLYYGDPALTQPTEAPTAVWEPDSPTTPGYVGVWHLEENGAGSPLEFGDSTKNANHGQGGEGDPLFLPTRVAGQIGYGQDFAPGAGTNPKAPPPDGKFDLVDLGHSARFDFPSDQITLQAWVRHNIVPAFGDWYGILGHKGVSDGYRLILQDGSLRLRFGLPPTTLVTSGGLSTGVWHHVVATCDGATMRVYIDGVQDATTAARTGNIIPPPGGDAEVYIGHGDQPKDRAWSYEWVGQIDEVRISRVARSAGWILTEYRNHTAPAPGSFYSMGPQVAGPHPTPAFTLLSVNYRSIGTNGGTLHGTGDASVALGSRVVSFAGGANLPPNVGTGDALTFTGAPAETLHILTRDSATQVTVQTPATFVHTSQTYTVTRAFTTLAAWETARQGDLVAENRREVGLAYDDGPFTAGVNIAGWTTDSTRHPMLVVANGHRHDGTAGTGVVLDGVDTDQGIRASTSHVVIDGFEFRRNREAGGGAASVVVQNFASDVLLRNLLVHDFFLAGETVSGIRGQNDSDYMVRNTIVYDGDIGIRNNAATARGVVENVTVHGMARWGVLASAGSLFVRNTIAMDNPSGDFSGTMVQGANISSDATATGTGALPGRNAIDQFVSITPGLENFHLKAGADAIDRGFSAYMPQYWTDIDGVSRLFTPAPVAGTPGPWDIGADEFGATTAVELMSFTASPATGAVDLSWTTASELSNLGFHLYRAETAEGPYTRITSSLIPGLGSSPTGRSYSYRDAGLTNGRAYYYELEDLETTGATKRHGPVSASPSAAPGGSDAPPGPTDAEGTGYGDPSSVVLREVERSPTHVVLELRTGGFRASPGEDGRVRLRIPGFESVSRPGEPSLPTRRVFVEAASGRKVRLASVLASDELHFPGLRPVAQGAPGVEVDEEGMVRASEESRGDGPGFERLFPPESALLLGASFQGETKKAEVLLFPLRWYGSGLSLSRRLRVRLEFAGAEPQEWSRGGSRGRRRVERPRHARSGVVAQITVKERGLQRVDYEDLFPPTSSPRPRGLSASSLRVSRQGEAVAFHLEPTGVPFGPGSSLYFLSEGPSLNAYADAVYELETNASGLLMDEETLSPSTSRAVGEYLETVRKEENHYYQSSLLDAPDLWLWDVVVSPGSKSFSFAVTDLAPSSSPGRLSVVLQGASDFAGVLDHHVRARVNGALVGETTWDGSRPETLEAEIPPWVLQEGTNSLELEDVGDLGASSSMVFLNHFSVSYPRRLVAVQGTLEGRFEATGVAKIHGASSSSFVLDTTGVARWLRGASVTPGGLGVSVEAGRSYLVTSTVVRPAVKRLHPSHLKSPANQADYLLLGPLAFLAAARPLLDLRESQGLVTKAVSVEEVYEQFGHGEVSPQAIKEFLEYAYHSWAAPSPRYVLLLGDASYDPKDHLQTGVKDRLPGFPVRTSYLWTVSDPAYASVNGDDLLPDVAIGRLPAGSVDDAERLVQKVLAFENGGGRLDGPAVLVADNPDLAGSFEANAEEIATTLLAPRNPRKIYYSVEGPNTRARIREAFDDGASLVSYVGHGGTAVWASENIFNYRDAATLQAQPQQPLLLTLNCLNGFFQFPPFDSLSEALLKAEGKGAVAAFSPSGLSVNEPAHVFHKAVLAEIVSGRHGRIGDALLAAQEAYARAGALPELLSIYHLFGDPALRIR